MSLARGALLVCLLAVGAPAAQADDVKTAPKPAPPKSAPAPSADSASTKSAATAPPAAVAAPDDELLEFLGSLDSETGDEDWLDYLSQTDIAKAAKVKNK